MLALLPGHRVDERVAVQVAALRRVRRIADRDVGPVDVELREAEADAVAARGLVGEQVPVPPVGEVEAEVVQRASATRIDVRPTTLCSDLFSLRSQFEGSAAPPLGPNPLFWSCEKRTNAVCLSEAFQSTRVLNRCPRYGFGKTPASPLAEARFGWNETTPSWLVYS